MASICWGANWGERHRAQKTIQAVLGLLVLGTAFFFFRFTVLLPRGNGVVVWD
jgi:hypothetical protein